MNLQATINGKDIWVTWKARLQRGTEGALLTPPEVKDFVTNSTSLRHGVLVDNPAHQKVKSREIQLQFVIRGDTREEFLTNFRAFKTELAGIVIVLYYAGIKESFHLLYKAARSYGRYGNKACKLVVTFLEPDPSNKAHSQATTVIKQDQTHISQ